MSRNIPIFVEPGYDSTRRSSEPATGHFEARHHRHPRFNDTDRIQEEFEDASNRFFEKNFRRRHTDFPDPTFWEKDFRSDSPPRYQERPFRRGSNPSDFASEFPTIGRRVRFDEMIGRMMREDSDSFDFWDPEYGNFHVERTPRKRHSPESARKSHEKVTKSPSAPVSGERNKGKFDRQSSTPSTSTTADDEGFVDIPVVVCKDGKTIDKVGKDERDKTPETGETKIKSVTQDATEVSTEGTGNQKFEKEKESEDESDELTVKISVDSTEEKSEKDSKKNDAEKLVNEQNKMPQESQQTAQMPQESQQTAQMPQENQQTAQMPQESQQNAQMPKESQKNAETPKESQRNAEIPKGTKETAEIPRESQQDTQLSKIKTIEDKLSDVAEKVKVFKPNGSKESDKEYLWLEEMLMRILMGLDAIEANGNKEIRGARKEVVKRVQIALNELETKSPEAKNKS